MDAGSGVQELFHTSSRMTIKSREVTSLSIGEPALPQDQVIYPPAAGTCPSGLTPYTIQPGDTLWELAQRGRTTVEVIMGHNPGLDPCNLPVGLVICVPFEAVVYPGYGVRR
jgi:LysM repeat protein